MSILGASLLQVPNLEPYDVWVDVIVIILLLIAVFLYFFRGGWGRTRVIEREKTVAPMPTAPPLAVRTLASASSGEVPFVVNFRSSAYGGKPPYKYRWDFGDGLTSEEPQPQHAFERPGGYFASLTITDSNGMQKRSDNMGVTAIAAPMAPSPPPVAASIMASATQGVAPLTISFKSLATGGKPPYKFLWQFDDGTTSEETEPQHTYLEKGVYHPQLMLSDSENDSMRFDGAEIVVEATPKPQAPKLTVSIMSSAAQGEAPLAVGFKAVASGGVPPYTYRWEFDDGTGSREPEPQHTFAKKGVYLPTLMIKDSQGSEEKVKGANIQVLATRPPPPPPAPPINGSVVASAAEGNAPLTVSFRSSVSGGRPPYRYLWQFDDGTTSRDQDPKHTFEKKGIYKVTVAVSDADGKEVKLEASNVQVAAVLPPREPPHAYCVKCQKKREIQDPVFAVWKSTNREVVRGKCPVCGTGLYRVVGKAGKPLPEMSSLK